MNYAKSFNRPFTSFSTESFKQCRRPKPCCLPGSPRSQGKGFWNCPPKMLGLALKLGRAAWSSLFPPGSWAPGDRSPSCQNPSEKGAVGGPTLPVVLNKLRPSSSFFSRLSEATNWLKRLSDKSDEQPITILSCWCQIPEDISTGGLPSANDGQTGFDKVWKLFVLFISRCAIPVTYLKCYFGTLKVKVRFLYHSTFNLITILLDKLCWWGSGRG